MSHPGIRERFTRPVGTGIPGLALLVLALGTFAGGALQPAAAQVREGRAIVEGVVLETGSERAVAGARLSVVGTSVTAVTDSAGAFLLEGVPGGHTVIDIFHDGRTGPPVYLELGTRERRWIELEVTRTAVPVPEIRVRIVESPSRLTGFRRRRAAGIGDFISEDEIRRRSPAVLSQLLRSSVGLDVGRDLPGGPRIASRRGECRLTYFLDGMRAEGLNIDALRPHDVVGLEIYHGGSRVPPQFVRRGSCGAVVIWTRDP